MLKRLATRGIAGGRTQLAGQPAPCGSAPAERLAQHPSAEADIAFSQPRIHSSRRPAGRHRRCWLAQHPSAKADIALSQPRTHSPRRLRAGTADFGSRNIRPRRRTSRCSSREFIRPGGCGPAPRILARAAPVREGGHRVFPAANSFARRPAGRHRRCWLAQHPSAKADIAFSQPRIHSPRRPVSAPLVRQAKPDLSCELKGVHHVKCL
jgi:hypothetical protein